MENKDVYNATIREVVNQVILLNKTKALVDRLAELLGDDFKDNCSCTITFNCLECDVIRELIGLFEGVNK
jgi:hypothetical protein